MLPIANENDLPLTPELLQAFGFKFIADEDAWVDEFGLKMYSSRLPETTMGLKRTMCGTAFRKGEAKVKRIAADNLLVRLFALPADPVQSRPDLDRNYGELFSPTSNY